MKRAGNWWPILLVLLWTNPSTNTDGSPLLDFAGVRLEGLREEDGFYFASDLPATVLDEEGIPHVRTTAGAADSTDVTLALRRRTEDWWRFWVSAYDSSANYSERSNEVRVSLTAGPGPVTGVEGGILPPGTEEWYDIHGRRIDRPIASGMYFRRRGAKTDKIIILK